MAFSSSFTRKDTPEGAEFAVKPAWPSPGVCIFAVLITWGLLAIALSEGSGPLFYFPVTIVGLLCLGIGSDIVRRKAVTIIANSNGLSAKGITYPVNDIAELIVKSGQGEESNGTVIAGGPGASAYFIGQAALQAQMKRSYSLMLRKRSHSRPVRLVYGLTSDTAHALMDDLIGDLK